VEFAPTARLSAIENVSMASSAFTTGRASVKRQVGKEGPEDVKRPVTNVTILSALHR
jgi:hypothetical protein